MKTVVMDEGNPVITPRFWRFFVYPKSTLDCVNLPLESDLDSLDLHAFDLVLNSSAEASNGVADRSADGDAEQRKKESVRRQP